LKAIIYKKFGAPLESANVPDPEPDEDAVVIKVKASGICRSDWHGWLGRDPDIKKLPHVPGHELAGIIEAIGKNVGKFRSGDKVTVPFVCGCGKCPECSSGNSQICDNQFQPGFTHWGSFAEYVSIKYADHNLVKLPEEIDFVTAASLGCRFATAFRACTNQSDIIPDNWVAVHGCGGVGLSTVMISNALGANVIAVDINQDALNLAKKVGAKTVINAKDHPEVAETIIKVTGRGAHVSLDALGSSATCTNSIQCLRKQGRHIQVGLLVGDNYRPRIPMDQVISKELQIYGSHGMQAAKYSDMFQMILSGKLNPERLIGKRISLEEVPKVLESMDQYSDPGITIIDRFE
jgi:alcohol dehydrogenase